MRVDGSPSRDSKRRISALPRSAAISGLPVFAVLIKVLTTLLSVQFQSSKVRSR